MPGTGPGAGHVAGSLIIHRYILELSVNFIHCPLDFGQRNAKTEPFTLFAKSSPATAAALSLAPVPTQPDQPSNGNAALGGGSLIKPLSAQVIS
jgi:hypothetical protein